MTFGAAGATTGLDNGRVGQGATINIYILMVRAGEAISNRSFAETVVHEFIHALGVPEFAARIDAAGSTFEREMTNDIFRGYDFAASIENAMAVETIIRIDNAASLTGTPGRDVLAASDRADSIFPGSGGDLIFPGTGDDSVFVTPGGVPDLVVDDGGTDRIVLPAGIDPGSITTRWSSDGKDLALLVNGTQEVIIEGANASGSVEYIDIGSVSFPVSSFASVTNSLPSNQSTVIDYFGAFGGGYVGNAASLDADNDILSYQLVALSGEFSTEVWQVDANSGVITAQFSKPDQTGSLFTSLIIRVLDGTDSVDREVTIRWAYSLEQNPEF